MTRKIKAFIIKGGRRENAGAKPVGDRAKSKINITIDSDLLEKIDSLCKKGERSSFIERLLIMAIEISEEIKMSNIWSLSLKGWADNCAHSKDPESALLGFILEKLAEKDLQGLAVVEQLLSKSDDELVNFLDSIELLGDSKL